MSHFNHPKVVHSNDHALRVRVVQLKGKMAHMAAIEKSNKRVIKIHLQRRTKEVHLRFSIPGVALENYGRYVAGGVRAIDTGGLNVVTSLGLCCVASGVHSRRYWSKSSGDGGFEDDGG